MTSDVSQGSVVSPIIFLIYLDYIPDGLSSCINKFSDDLTIMKEISNDAFEKKIIAEGYG